jgi:hypothetical protein
MGEFGTVRRRVQKLQAVLFFPFSLHFLSSRQLVFGREKG